MLTTPSLNLKLIGVAILVQTTQYIWAFNHTTDTTETMSTMPAMPTMTYALVPDEQKLYEILMDGYEKSVRPVHNSSTVILIKFGLYLNQIIGLDERHQVLTTNVFIDQLWTDENLLWDPEEHNGIRSLRIPTRNVWLPDTFLYNNADGGSSGFMQGTYVLVNYNGTVLWPVPVKLKSSCKVDITFFPFDDQKCILRFGSWIYSGLWMDYVTMYPDRSIDLSSYVNNSEWDLLSVVLRKHIRNYKTSDPHPDLTYTLYVRRKTFYYIFNIIVPCIMLSTLTLLTFWLPPTSGEKITLGLSVFLAFSMFMLLIAEEVPATSEAVPLIGIYLCVVMTLTSLSVIMAVMVINLYNRGTKMRRAPNWIRRLVLVWISCVLRMRHDLERVVETITLETDNDPPEAKGSIKNRRGTSMRKTRETALNSIQEFQATHQTSVRRRDSSRESCSQPEAATSAPSSIEIPETQPEPEPEVIWLRRDEVYPELSKPTRMEFEEENATVRSNHHDHDSVRPKTSVNAKRHTKNARGSKCDKSNRKDQDLILALQPKVEDIKSDLHYRKLIVAEWQRVAAVVDRVLFWIYFFGTIVSYLVILIIIPKQNYDEWNAQIHHHVPTVRSDSRYTM